ncbi:hypothetical protein MHU86_17177 [Fragilaria crotonensis]|nr:hypothetical protein MHU86_17177 [Fragilaria crotonensis]
MPLSIQTFPGWRPIKYKANIFLSGFFILISLALLNPAVLVPDGLDVGGLTLKAEMCKPFDRQAGLEELRAEVLEITNYTIAVKQWSHLFRFQKALLNDTSRYGNLDHSFLDTAGAREAAKLTALSATCVDEKCGCPRIPSTGFTRFFGIDNLEVCWVARICLRSPWLVLHTRMMTINPDNYNEAQLNATDVGEPSINPTRSKLSDASKQAAKAGIMLLLYQVDVASNIYSVYVIVALFFPTPLRVFRLPYMVAIKRFLFGADQKMFIIIFVSSIWIYKYVMEYLTDPDLAIVLANFLRGDPCYLDGKYVYERFAIIDEICDKLIPLQPSFETKMMTVPQSFPRSMNSQASLVKAAISPCSTCLRFERRSFRSHKSVRWDLPKSPAHMCARRNPNTCRVLLPAENLTFYGNRTICLNSDYAKSRALVNQIPNSHSVPWGKCGSAVVCWQVS